MSVGVCSSNPDGSHRVPLESVGPTSGLKFTMGAPGGGIACSVQIGLPVDANPEALRLGRFLEVWDGPLIVGRFPMQTPQRGTPWSLTGSGMGSLFANFVAIDGSGNITTNANTALDQAISRGLVVTRGMTFPTPTVSVDASDLGSLMNAVALASGQNWFVDARGHTMMAALPTAVEYVLVASSTPGGSTLAAYATDLYAKYVTTSGGTPALVAAAGNPSTYAYGRRIEAIYDTTPGGPMSSTNAALVAGGVLASVGPHPSFSGALTVTPGSLLTPGGQPARLSLVKAAAGVKIAGVAPDPARNELMFTTAITVNIGQWDYDADSDTGTLTPYGAQVQSLSALLSAPTAPEPGTTVAAAPFVGGIDWRGTLKINNKGYGHLTF